MLANVGVSPVFATICSPALPDFSLVVDSLGSFVVVDVGEVSSKTGGVGVED